MYYREHIHIEQTQTQISTPYFFLDRTGIRAYTRIRV